MYGEVRVQIGGEWVGLWPTTGVPHVALEDVAHGNKLFHRIEVPAWALFIVMRHLLNNLHSEADVRREDAAVALRDLLAGGLDQDEAASTYAIGGKAALLALLGNKWP